MKEEELYELFKIEMKEEENDDRTGKAKMAMATIKKNKFIDEEEKQLVSDPLTNPTLASQSTNLATPYLMMGSPHLAFEDSSGIS